MEHIGAFIIVRNTTGEILLGLRKNAYKSGFWGFPGGRLEQKETLTGCCHRELSEETGITPVRLEYIGVIREFQATYNFIHFGFLCPEWKGTIENKEPEKCNRWQWFAPDSLSGLVLPAHRRALEFLHPPETGRYIEIC